MRRDKSFSDGAVDAAPCIALNQPSAAPALTERRRAHLRRRTTVLGSGAQRRVGTRPARGRDVTASKDCRFVEWGLALAGRAPHRQWTQASCLIGIEVLLSDGSVREMI